MSGGSGGIIIIRNSIRDLGRSGAVQENLSPAKCAQLNAILDKQTGDWSKAEFRKVVALIVKAESDCE